VSAVAGDIWYHDLGFLRATADFLIFGAIVVLGSRRGVKAPLLLGWVAWWVLSFLVILRWYRWGGGSRRPTRWRWDSSCSAPACASTGSTPADSGAMKWRPPTRFVWPPSPRSPTGRRPTSIRPRSYPS